MQYITPLLDKSFKLYKLRETAQTVILLFYIWLVLGFRLDWDT